MGNLVSAAASFGITLPASEGVEANSVDILGSRSLLEALLQTEFRFRIRPWRFGPPVARVQTLQAYVGGQNLDQALRRMDGILSVDKDLKSKVLTLSVDTRSPELSQQVARRAVDLLEDFFQKKNRTRGGEKAAFATARLADARSAMAAAEENLRHFLDYNRNYQISGDPSIRLRGARLELELRLQQQLVTTLTLSREQALMEGKNDMAILNIMDSANLPIEKSGPKRAQIVLASALLATVAAWGWQNRTWILAVYFPREGAVPQAAPAPGESR